MELEKEISEEELILYDRQRFIGIDVQKKLINSKVMINCMSAINTELAKNLILSGVNIYIYDSALINEIDVETNFLLTSEDLNKKRSEVIA